jgi:hypothetical protein
MPYPTEDFVHKLYIPVASSVNQSTWARPYSFMSVLAVTAASGGAVSMRRQRGDSAVVLQLNFDRVNYYGQVVPSPDATDAW